MMKIGYQGIPGSNSEAAAAEFAADGGWDDFELVPLVNSRNVVDALDSGRVEYGVVAVSNITAGPVGETSEALAGRVDILHVASRTVPVHHCVFSLREGCRITALSSHVQALMQCDGNLSRLFPGAERIETDDTALSAEHLAEGRYPEGVAAVCRRNAGEMFGLHLVAENVEDNEDNMTEFHLLRMDRPRGSGEASHDGHQEL
jgi:prephenate dehydratase